MKREQWLQLGGAAFFALFLVTFNNVSLVVLLRSFSYYRDVFITFGASWLLFNYISRVTYWLDHRLDWAAAVAGRVAGQFLVGVGGGALLAYGIAYGQYRWIDPEHVFGTDSFLEVEFPVIVLVICFINLLYGGISYYQWRESKLNKLVPTPLSEPAPPAYLTSLVATNGHRKINVPCEQIASISVEHGLTWVVTFDNARYHVDESLQTLQERLDPHIFFRVNRQTVVQLSACYSYQSAEYGKIRLRLVPPFTTQLVISQKTAPAFRKWMQR